MSWEKLVYMGMIFKFKISERPESELKKINWILISDDPTNLSLSGAILVRDWCLHKVIRGDKYLTKKFMNGLCIRRSVGGKSIDDVRRKYGVPDGVWADTLNLCRIYGLMKYLGHTDLLDKLNDRGRGFIRILSFPKKKIKILFDLVGPDKAVDLLYFNELTYTIVEKINTLAKSGDKKTIDKLLAISDHFELREFVVSLP